MNSRSKSIFNIFTIITLLVVLFGMVPASQAQAESPRITDNLTRANVMEQASEGIVQSAVAPSLSITFTVNSTLDQPDDLTIPGTCHTATNTCTLRAAIMQANRTSGLGAAIIVPPGLYKLTIPSAGADGEDNGDLNLTTPTSGNPIITITGAGSDKTVIDANQLDRVFHTELGRHATISGVTIRNGFCTGFNPVGSGIYNEGVLVVNNAVITGNHCVDSGGGIYNNGTLAVTNSTLNKNTANNTGGGIYSFGTLTVDNSTISQNTGYMGGGIESYLGSAKISNSTISGNTAINGGGIYVSHDSLIVVNSTISQNNATQDGGGIYGGNNAVSNIYNSTIVFNQADSDADVNGGIAGGVFTYSAATFNLRNSLVAGNYLSGAPTYDDCNGIINSYGRNLIGAQSVTTISSCTVQLGGGSWTLLNDLNLLGVLQNNGGPTATVALLSGSNAIDGGDPSQGCIDESSIVIATDQRGNPRVQGAQCDIGAYELAGFATINSLGTGDGWVLESGETSKVGGTMNSSASTFNVGDDTAKKQYLGILSFKTSNLPDNAVITKVTLKVKKNSVVGGGNPVTLFLGFMVDIKKGFFGTSALQASDFQSVASKTFGPFKPAIVGGWYAIDLTNGNTYINKLTTSSGLTQIRLRFKLDDNNDTIANFLKIYSGDAGAANRPQLLIEYYVP